MHILCHCITIIHYITPFYPKNKEQSENAKERIAHPKRKKIAHPKPLYQKKSHPLHCTKITTLFPK